MRPVKAKPPYGLEPQGGVGDTMPLSGGVFLRRALAVGLRHFAFALGGLSHHQPIQDDDHGADHGNHDGGQGIHLWIQAQFDF